MQQQEEEKVFSPRLKKELQHLIDGLNPAQQEAVLHSTGPVLVIAGAGTGKTKVITNRIAYLIQSGQALPEEILALTFTDKAAQEMQDRVDELLPYGVVETNIMTFHALGGMLLRDYALDLQINLKARLASPVQQHILLHDTLENMEELQYFRPAHNPTMYTEAILRYISRLKDEGIGPEDLRGQIADLPDAAKDLFDQVKYQELADVYGHYERRKLAEGFLDFGDQLMLPYVLLSKKQHILEQIQKQYKFILVDEFQDTNTIQAKLLYLLSKKHQNLMVVGDDDQSIYRFRGAELDNILSFHDFFPSAKQIVLIENYRSTQQIIDASYELIQHNNPARLETKLQIDKRLHAQSQGRAVAIEELGDIRSEIDRVVQLVLEGASRYGASSVAVLTRNNQQAETIIRALQQKAVPVATQIARNLLLQPIVRQCIDFLCVLHDETDSAALYRFLLSPRVAADAEVIISLSAEAKREHKSLAQRIRECGSEVAYVYAQLERIQAYRQRVREISVGELLYEFVTSDGYLERLIARAEDDAHSARDIQSLARFFNLISELEAVEGMQSSHDLWLHIREMYDLEVLTDPDESEQIEGVHVLTAHRSKGLEFDRVVLFDLVEGTFPATRKGESLYLPQQMSLDKGVSIGQVHLSEERRLFYVAVTRAKQELFVTYSCNHGGKRLKKPSRFLLEAFGYDIQPKASRKVELSTAMIHQFDGSVTEPGKLTFPEKDGWLTLTPNQINDYLTNPQYFYVRHVLRFPEKQSHRMVYGTSIHAALEVYLRQRMQGKKVSFEELLLVLRDSWSHNGFVSLRHEQERMQAAEDTLRKTWQSLEATDLQIVDVERAFQVDFEEYKVRVRGRYDLILQNQNGIEIRDFKTSSVNDQKAAQNRVRDSVPMQIYALAWSMEQPEKPLSLISLHFVDSGIVATRDKLNHVKTRARIQEVAEGIRAAHYPKKGNLTNLEMEGIA